MGRRIQHCNWIVDKEWKETWDENDDNGEITPLKIISIVMIINNNNKEIKIELSTLLVRHYKFVRKYSYENLLFSIFLIHVMFVSVHHKYIFCIFMFFWFFHYSILRLKLHLMTWQWNSLITNYVFLYIDWWFL